MPVTGQQISQGATAAAGGTVSTLVALHIMSASAAAGPIGIAIGGAVVAIGVLSGKIAHLINGCGDACVQATAIVNEADTYVQQIASAYWQVPHRTVGFQKWTLQEMDKIFDQVRALCGKIPGDPGRKCVQERLTRGFRPPWCKDSSVPLSQCGGWLDVTYDPIAMDPGVQPDPGPVDVLTAGIGQLTKALPGGYGIILVAGLAVFAFVAYKVRT